MIVINAGCHGAQHIKFTDINVYTYTQHSYTQHNDSEDETKCVGHIDVTCLTKKPLETNFGTFLPTKLDRK